MNNTKIFTIAHKGASSLVPANTLRAFQKAIKLKADLIEFDIQVSKDGEIVIHHDSNTFATTGYNGQVNEMTLKKMV